MDLALLDTDTVSEILKQRNLQVTATAALYLQEHGEFAFSLITRFELLRGLRQKNATLQLPVLAILRTKFGDCDQ